MPRTIRYYPHVKADWVTTFPVMTQWGYNAYVPMGEVMDNCGINGTNEAIDADSSISGKVKTQYELEDFIADDDLTPTLWFERRTGTLLLRPKQFEYTYAHTTLNSSATWDKEYSPRITGTPASDVYSWLPMESTSMNNIWKEEDAHLPFLSIDPDTNKLLGSYVSKKFIHLFNFNSDNKTGYTLHSDFDLVKNGSFCIVIGLPVSQASNQTVPHQAIIGFGSQSFFIKWVNGQKPELLDAGGKVIETIRLSEDPASGYSNTWKEKMNVYAFFVQILYHSIAISNGIQIDSKKSIEDPKESKLWVWKDASITSLTSGLKLESSPLSITIKGGPAYIAYIPIEYCSSGTLLADETDMTYKPTQFEMEQVAHLPGDTFIDQVVSQSGTTYTWSVQLQRVKSGGTDNKNLTPILFGVKFNGEPIYESAFFSWLPAIRSEDIISCSLNETVQDKSCTLVVWNRGGRFKELYGMYPIKVSIGQKTGPERIGDFDNAPTGEPTMYPHIYGFVTDIQFSRPDAAQSTVTLTIKDRKIQLQDSIAVNLPIYDGWNHIDAIKDIANRGGFQSNADIVNDADNLSPSDLPNSGFMKEPLYMFNAGTSIWECLEKVRQWSQWWLFCDENGKLRYRNPNLTDVSHPNPTRAFKEVPSTVNAYDELKRLDVTKQLNEIMNAILVQGLDYNYRIPRLIPVMERISIAGAATRNPGYIPWNRFVIISDAALNSPSVVSYVARETWNRASRPRIYIRFEAWGQPDLYPLDVVEIDEAEKETGIMELDSFKHFRITSITHDLNKGSGEYRSTIEGEWIDPFYKYDPYWR